MDVTRDPAMGHPDESPGGSEHLVSTTAVRLGGLSEDHLPQEVS